MPRGGSKPGQRRGGRKAGVPNKATADVRDAAQLFTRSAVAVLASIMRDKSQPAAARVAAANGILDRGHGKARQPVDHDLDLSKLTDEQLNILALALGSTTLLGEGDGGDGSAEETG